MASGKQVKSVKYFRMLFMDGPSNGGRPQWTRKVNRKALETPEVKCDSNKKGMQIWRLQLYPNHIFSWSAISKLKITHTLFYWNLNLWNHTYSFLWRCHRCMTLKPLLVCPIWAWTMDKNWMNPFLFIRALTVVLVPSLKVELSHPLHRHRSHPFVHSLEEVVAFVAQK